MSRSNYTNVAANSAGASITTDPGTLKRIVINTKGASSNVLTVYDGESTSGTKIATIDTTAAVGHIEYACRFSTGLFYVLATGTAADITFIWE